MNTEQAIILFEDTLKELVKRDEVTQLTKLLVENVIKGRLKLSRYNQIIEQMMLSENEETAKDIAIKTIEIIDIKLLQTYYYDDRYLY